MKLKKLIAILLLVALIILPYKCFATSDTENEGIEPRWYTPDGDWPGYIFATLDNTTSSWNHGHAGLGGNNGETIESFPSTGVAVFSNGYSKNWSSCSTGGIYSINGASSSQYDSAKNYAYNKVGTPYSLSLVDGDSTYYCSELVYKAWKNAGITVGTNVAGFITPKSIMDSSNTRLVYSF